MSSSPSVHASPLTDSPFRGTPPPQYRCTSPQYPPTSPQYPSFSNPLARSGYTPTSPAFSPPTSPAFSPDPLPRFTTSIVPSDVPFYKPTPSPHSPYDVSSYDIRKDAIDAEEDVYYYKLCKDLEKAEDLVYGLLWEKGVEEESIDHLIREGDKVQDEVLCWNFHLDVLKEKGEETEMIHQAIAGVKRGNSHLDDAYLLLCKKRMKVRKLDVEIRLARASVRALKECLA